MEHGVLGRRAARRTRRALQLCRDGLRRAADRGGAQGASARLSRVLRAAVVPARRRGARRRGRAARGSRALRHRRARDAAPPRRVHRPYRNLRGPVGAGAPERARRPRRRHRARQPLGVQRDGRQVGVPPRPRPHVRREEHRRPALQRIRLRRIDGRPRLGRPWPHRRPRRSAGRDRALRPVRFVRRRRRRSRGIGDRPHAANVIRTQCGAACPRDAHGDSDASDRPAAGGRMARAATADRPLALRAVRPGAAQRTMPRNLPDRGDRARAAPPCAAGRHAPAGGGRVRRPRLDAGVVGGGPRHGPPGAASPRHRRRHHARLRHVGPHAHRRRAT